MLKINIWYKLLHVNKKSLTSGLGIIPILLKKLITLLFSESNVTFILLQNQRKTKVVLQAPFHYKVAKKRIFSKYNFFKLTLENNKNKFSYYSKTDIFFLNKKYRNTMFFKDNTLYKLHRVNIIRANV